MTNKAEMNEQSTAYETVDFFPLDPAVHDDFWNANTRVREQCPAGWNTALWSVTEQPGQWIVNDYQSVMKAAIQWELFSSAGGVSSVQMPLDVIRLLPVESDPPIHRQMRKALNPFFTPEAVAENAAAVAAAVEELLDQCLDQDCPVDFVASFTNQLPPVIFRGPGFLDTTAEQADALISLVSILLTKPEMTVSIAPKLLAWCADLLETRRAEGRRDGLPGAIAHMGFGENGFELTERERVEILNLAVMGGMETTMGGLGTLAWLLATKPELRAELGHADERTLDRAVEEVLRFASPVPTEGRTVTEDSEFQGCPMKVGDRVLLNFAAANLDPVQFPDPLNIDIHRSNVRSHLAFGAGIHRCLGAHLARLEMKVAMRAICALKRFELEPGHQVAFRAAFARGPVALPVFMSR